VDHRPATFGARVDYLVVDITLSTPAVKGLSDSAEMSFHDITVEVA
jgi:hypothetical protein